MRTPGRRGAPARRRAGYVALLVTLAELAHAQVTLDGSLGQATTLAGPNYRVEAGMGVIRGANLFHSFGRFGLVAGERASFAGPAGIANIVARVTGGQTSSIDGTIASEIPGASLYLLNPAGMVFGPNASTAVLGGLHVSTADYLRLSDGARFFANAAATSTLSGAPPTAFGFLGPGPAGVRFEGARGRAPGSAFDAGIGAAAGADFSVSAGSIVLGDGTTVAGDRVGAGLYSYGGRIALTAASGAGEVALPGGTPGPAAAPTGGEVRLGGLAEILQQEGGGIAIRGGSIVFEGGAALHAQTLQRDVPGGLLVEGRDIDLRDQAEVTSVAFGGAPGAPLTLRAQGSFTARTSFGAADSLSRVGSVYSAALDSGPAGTLEIAAARIELTGSTLISGQTAGTGAGADVRVGATESVRIAGNASVLAFTGAGGRAGSLELRAPRIDFEDAGSINTKAFASGRGGDVHIVADDMLRLASSNGIAGGSGGTGPSGSIRIDAGRVRIERGAVSSRTDGAAPAGSIIVVAPNGLTLTGGAIQSGTFGDGDAGAIVIRAGDVWIDNARIESASGSSGTSSSHRGRAGEVTIDARTMLISSGGVVNASTTTAGQAGDVTIRADEFAISDGEVYSTSGGLGRAGTVAIDAGASLLLVGDALIRSNALDRGAAGSVRLHARELSMALGARVETRTLGDQPAGTIVVQADRILLIGGAQIGSTSGYVNLSTGEVSVGRGDGGNVAVSATQSIELTGVGTDRFALPSGLFAQTLGAGRGGSVSVTTPSLTLANGAQIRTDTSGAGAAGRVHLAVDRLEMRGGASIRSDSSVITSQQTTLRGDGAAGGVQVDATGLVDLSGSSTRISSSTSGAGAGGSVVVAAREIRISNGASLQAGSAGNGAAGDVIATAADSIRLTGGASIAGEAASSDGGNVTVNARRLVYLAGSSISASVGAQGNGGNVSIDPQFVVLQDGGRIVAKAVAGAGGNIAIRITDGGAYVASAESEVSATSQFGVDGTVHIEGPGRDPASGLRELSVAYLDAAGLVRTPCAARRARGAGSLVVAMPAAISARLRPVAPGSAPADARSAGGAPDASPFDLDNGDATPAIPVSRARDAALAAEPTAEGARARAIAPGECPGDDPPDRRAVN